MDERQLYQEFLDDGKIRSHIGRGGKAFVANNERWWRDGNQLHVETDEGEGIVHVSVGSISADRIEGTTRSGRGSEDVFEWFRER